MHSHQHSIQIDKASAGPCRWRLNITVPAERLEEEKSCFLSSAAKSLNIDGFRKGKVPPHVAKQHLGDAFDSEAKEHIVDHIVREALRESNLEILSIHDFDKETLEIPKDGTLQFHFEVETAPSVELLPWDELDIDIQNTEPQDDQIEQAIKGLGAGHPRFEEVVDQAVDDTHIAEADIEFLRGDESGPSANGLRLAPSSPLYGSDPETFAKALTGAKAGGTVKVAVDFQDGFEIPEWVGTQGEAIIRVRKVVKPRPSTEEELAQDLTEGDVENLKTQIRTRIEVENEANERDRRVFTAIQRITEKKPFELPAALIQEETEALVRAQARNLQEQEGLSEEDAKAKAEESRAQANPEAKRRLQHHFVLNAIARQETIQVSPTELDSALKAIGERHGVPPADVRKAYEERGMLRELEGEILEAKARSFVAQKITPAEESPEVATAASDE